MVYHFFHKRTESVVSVKEQLAEELLKQVIKKLKRRKFYARFKDNIWATDLDEMETFSSKNKNVKYLLCVRDVFTKYAWVRLLKDKRGKQFLMLLTKWDINLIVNQINYGLIKEAKFTINLCKHD